MMSESMSPEQSAWVGSPWTSWPARLHDLAIKRKNAHDLGERRMRMRPRWCTGTWENGNCIGTMKYQNGDEYTGKIVRNVRSGKGATTYKNGAVFDGEWVLVFQIIRLRAPSLVSPVSRRDGFA